MPETALVDQETLKDVLAVDGYEMEMLDTVDMRDVERLIVFILGNSR